MPSRLRLPLATNQYTHGRASFGGLRNIASVAANGGSTEAVRTQADSTQQARERNRERMSW
ncbi:MAG: hypothetical protein NTW21_29010 [Verrucomicrobia bacterium]|nr:hypothetical protein [Verrucomicrobiota bacterium]